MTLIKGQLHQTKASLQDPKEENKTCRHISTLLCETETDNATSQPSRPSFAIFHLCFGNIMLLLADFTQTQIAAEPKKCVRIRKVTEENQFSGANWSPIFIETLWTSKNRPFCCHTLKLFAPNSVKWLSHSTVMVSCALFILGPLWIHILAQACRGEELSREAVLSWFRERLLEGLGLEEPPLTTVQGPDGDTAQAEARHAPRRVPRTSRTAWVNHQTSPTEETSQIILFPSSGKKLCRFFKTCSLYFHSFIPKHNTFILDL